MELTTTNTKFKEGLVIDMKLKAGDVVGFKKYEDMTGDEVLPYGD